MSDLIRPAMVEELDEIVRLAAQKRSRYQAWQPIFHRVHRQAQERHRAYLFDKVHNPDTLMLVYERQGFVLGFALGEFKDAPPVYDVAGKVMIVDDFYVKEPEDWPEVGGALIRTMWKKGLEKHGATLVNVVCSPKDEPKRQALIAAGLSVASEWWVGRPQP